MEKDRNRRQKSVALSNLNQGMEEDIKSLTADELDWSKKSKYGKKSNENFGLWLDLVGNIMHARQTMNDDCIFDQLQ